MELHKALKKAIQKFGNEIITKDILLNILDDYNAFPSKSPIKFILKTFISTGLCSKILLIGDDRWEAKELILQFVKSTGCDFKLVSGVYLAIAYSLDWLYVYGDEKEANEHQATLKLYNPGPEDIYECDGKNIIYNPWLGYVYAKNHLLRLIKSHLLNNKDVLFDCTVMDDSLLLVFKIKKSYYSFLNDHEFYENCGQFIGRMECRVYCDCNHDDIGGLSDDLRSEGVSIGHISTEFENSNENDIVDEFNIRIERNIAEVCAIRVSYY